MNFVASQKVLTNYQGLLLKFKGAADEVITLTVMEEVVRMMPTKTILLLIQVVIISTFKI